MASFFFEDPMRLLRGPFYPSKSYTLAENLNALSFLVILGFVIATILQKPAFAILMYTLCSIASVYYVKANAEPSLTLENQYTPAPVQRTAKVLSGQYTPKYVRRTGIILPATGNSVSEMNYKVQNASYTIDRASRLLIPYRR